MRYLCVLVALVVTIAGCAGQMESSSISTATTWQQQMDLARRFAAAHKTYELALPSKGIFVFKNNPGPFCYTYMVPAYMITGDWQPAQEPGAFRSTGGVAFAGVLFVLARDLEGFEGSTLPERARTAITRDYEKRLGQPLTGVEWVPFEPARPGTWKWKAAPVVGQDGRYEMFPVKVIVDLSQDPDAVAVITVGGTGDDDGLARRVIETLRTTREPECYFPVLEKMLKTMLGER